MKRSYGAAVLAVATLGGAAVIAPQANAATTQDFVVIGMPGRVIAGHVEAGAIEIRRRDGRAQYIAAPTPADWDQFGKAVSTADLDGDKHGEVLVGAPGRDVSGKAGAGAVFVYKDSASGFKLWKAIVQGRNGTGGELQAGAGFGWSLDGSCAGAPSYDIGAAKDAGVVACAGSNYLWTASAFGDAPAAYDRFGTSLAGTPEHFAVGAPGRTVNGFKGAGAVFTQNEFNEQVVTQDSVDNEGRAIPDKAEEGDHFGQALAWVGDSLMVGVPSEDVDGVSTDYFDAGAVQIIKTWWGGGFDSGFFYTQNSSGVPGAAASGATFGAALGAYEYGPSGHNWFYIGVPGAKVGTANYAGLVLTLREDSTWTAFSDGTLGGTPETGDRLGTGIGTSSDYGFGTPSEQPFVAFGATGENGVGIVHGVVGFPKTNWQLTAATRQHSDRYGSSIAVGR